MNNFELKSYLFGYDVKVTCADDFPPDARKHRFWVVNTDRCGGRGIHWVAFHFPLRGPAEFLILEETLRNITTPDSDTF